MIRWSTWTIFFFCHLVTISDQLIITVTIDVRSKLCSILIVLCSKFCYYFIFLYRISSYGECGSLILSQKAFYIMEQVKLINQGSADICLYGDLISSKHYSTCQWSVWIRIMEISHQVFSFISHNEWEFFTCT
jgi:hypothetical protein